MRNFSRLSLIVILASAGAFAQSTDVILVPELPTLVAGGGAQTLTVSTAPSSTLASIPFKITWNGVSKNFQIISSSYPYGTRIAVSLTADDLALSQLGQLAIYDSRTNTLIVTLAMPVVYPVAAAATLYDNVHGKLYLTTGATTIYGLSGGATSTADSRFAVNSLIAIDVNTGAITNTLGLGAAGESIALSDDASTLYVGVAPGIVRRIDPVAFTAIGDFSVASGGGTTYTITNLTVMPGTASTLLVEYSAFNTSGAAFGIFDSGVQRPNTLETSSAPFQPYSNILFSPDARYIFVGNGDHFPATTERYDIDAKGFVISTRLQSPGGAPVSIIGDTLYAQQGLSINWKTMLPDGNLGNSGVLAADAVNSRLLATFQPPQYASYQAILQAFDLTSQVPLGTMQLPLAPAKLIRFGTDGLIAPTRGTFSGGPILFFHTPLAGPAPAVTPNGIVSAASFSAGAITPARSSVFSEHRSARRLARDSPSPGRK